MSKVKKMTVGNLKAISNLTADFNGCTAIITGGNNKGKTTFLRGLFDRVRGIKPDHVIKEGETSGFAEAELTTGEKLRWEFTADKEKLIYITEKDIRTSLTMELRKKFLPEIFDVDEFLQAPPKVQREKLQKLVGLDFTTIDAEHRLHYQDRENKNRDAKKLQTMFESTVKPAEVTPVVVTELIERRHKLKDELNNKYLENKAANDVLKKAYAQRCAEIMKDVNEFNAVQEKKMVVVKEARKLLDQLQNLGYNGLEVLSFIDGLLEQIEMNKVYKAPEEPEYVKEMPDDAELKKIDEEINSANNTNNQAAEYQRWLNLRNELELANNEAAKADDTVKRIEAERMDMIKSANMPEGFGFNEDGITYNGLPFTREQLSSSGIYIAALKLAAMTLGEVKALHFDASFLDKNSLSDIEKWAADNDLQLLIERPDFEAGEIEYQLLNCE